MLKILDLYSGEPHLESKPSYVFIPTDTSGSEYLPTNTSWEIGILGDLISVFKGGVSFLHSPESVRIYIISWKSCEVIQVCCSHSAQNLC